MEKRTLEFLLDKPIAYHRCLVPVAGSVNAAIMLSQALYWSKRTTGPNGWFWKTQEEWEEETGLTRYEQEGARKLLKKTGFWNEKLVGVPATLHFEIDYDVLDKVLSQTSMGKNHKLDSEGTTNQYAEKPQTIGTEITSETTHSQRETAPPVELPRGFPKTEQAAIISCSTSGVPKQFIIDDWNECHARGGKDRQGHAIFCYASHIKSAHNRARSWKEEHKLTQTNGVKVKSMDEGSVYDCL